MIELAKRIDGVPVSLSQLPELANYQLIKKVILFFFFYIFIFVVL